MSDPSPALAFVVSALTIVAALSIMGQPTWCAQGDVAPWSFDVASAHNSQHLIDPYTLTHVLHGGLLCAVLWLLARDRVSPLSRFGAAMGLEAAWEIFENTPFVVERYRATTVSLDYYGDSIVNSVADLAACALGYGAAAWLPACASVGGFFAIEAVLLLWIRDSLVLNLVMLIRPIDAVLSWQLGG